MTILLLIIALLPIIAMWMMFQKASQPGWAAIIPIYNFIVLLKVAGKPFWWIFLFMIPGVNVVFMILMYLALAKAFGKGTGFAVGLILLPFIFLCILAFSDAKYTAIPVSEEL